MYLEYKYKKLELLWNWDLCENYLLLNPGMSKVRGSNEDIYFLSYSLAFEKCYKDQLFL